MTDVMDDEDEFVDAVSENEDSVQVNGSSEEDVDGDADDGFGDDDFGEFAAEEDDEDQDHGHEEYDPQLEQQTQKLEQGRISQPIIQQPPSEPHKPPLKQFDFTNKSKEEIRQEIFQFLEQANPSPSPPQPIPPDEPIEPLNNERAMSLWNQLAAPVPLNPPDWKRSRIRRLFLVSLGIPVNLDEILPASGKKKKLVLPSTKPEIPVSSISGKAPPLAPPFDSVSARHKANVSALALKNMTGEELQDHVKTLKMVNAQASESLTYWLARREEAVGEKESLEGVIESLVGWTERQRKGTTGIAMVPGRGKTPPPQNVKKGKKK